MPVVKMGSGAQTQAKHCWGRREGYRFGCQVQFTFLSAFVRGEGESETCCYSLLTSVFSCGIQVELWTRCRLRTRGKDGA